MNENAKFGSVEPFGAFVASEIVQVGTPVCQANLDRETLNFLPPSISIDDHRDVDSAVRGSPNANFDHLLIPRAKPLYSPRPTGFKALPYKGHCDSGSSDAFDSRVVERDLDNLLVDIKPLLCRADRLNRETRVTAPK